MGVGPIPRSAMLDYAHECGLWGDEIEYFTGVIRLIDAEYMRINNSSDKDMKYEEVPITDVEGTKQIMSRLVARAASAKKGK